MVNSGEVLCKGRDVRQAKGAACRAALPCPPHWGGRIRLEPKGMWPGAEAQRSSAAAEVPPAERHDLTRSGNDEERGKPVALPFGQGRRETTCRGCGQRMGEQANAAL